MANSYVIVVFGAASGACDLSHCPMHAVGPFDTREQAHAAGEQIPKWMEPHILDVRPGILLDEPLVNAD